MSHVIAFAQMRRAVCAEFLVTISGHEMERICYFNPWTTKHLHKAVLPEAAVSSGSVACFDVYGEIKIYIVVMAPDLRS